LTLTFPALRAGPLPLPLCGRGVSPEHRSAAIARVLVIVGLVIVAVGLLWPWLARLGLGRLPGDISIHGEHGSFYFPLATSLLVSVVLSLVLWLINR
jgi:hypothetical protein